MKKFCREEFWLTGEETRRDDEDGCEAGTH